MNRVLLFICVIAAAGLTVAGAAIQGSYSNRWSEPGQLIAAGEKLKTVPESFGDWRMKANEEWGPHVTNLLQCSGYIHRTYENIATGQTINVAVIVGPPGPTSVHIPEICYSSKAYDIQGQSKRFSVPRADGTSDDFWGVTFRSLDLGTGLLRVGYAWSDGGHWVAPDHPRISMRKHTALYKIQLSASIPAGADPRNFDPCREFIEDFLPVLDQALIEPSSE